MDIQALQVPPEYAADVSNMVFEYCSDGVDAFESYLCQSASLDAATMAQIQQKAPSPRAAAIRSSNSRSAMPPVKPSPASANQPTCINPADSSRILPASSSQHAAAANPAGEARSQISKGSAFMFNDLRTKVDNSAIVHSPSTIVQSPIVHSTSSIPSARFSINDDAKVDNSFSLFEQLCKASVFRIPVQILLPNETPHLPPLSASKAASTAEMDQKLLALRSQLQEMNAECGDLAPYASLAAISAQWTRPPSTPRPVPATPDTINENQDPALATRGKPAGSGGLLADVKALAGAAAQLHPLMEKARQLRAAQREPLHARRVQGSNREAASLAEWRSSLHMKAVGDLDNLQHLHSSLMATNTPNAS
eukprot:gene25041-10688_t